ncbi:unnamed protein product [Candidula unifasciata]|uniref:Uncharacterized protein n=1 Tax=Candidula unifasciata TaxID=100452 RepID=A0A8S3ZTT1_9EUPU|nr:unnamed protein product [Candidula unifasciata]
MSVHSELGISPALLQAIAQTLTSSALTTSSRDSALPTIAKDKSQAAPHSLGSHQLKDRIEASMSLNKSSAGGVISHLLQNLNEPVASLITQSNVSSHAIQSLASTENSSIMSQAGLSLLGLSSSGATTTSGLNLTNTSVKHFTQPSMVMSNDEITITNFLLKDEPSDDLEQSILQQSSQPMNTVSSVLTAFASQHMKESLTKKTHKQSHGVSASQLQQQSLDCSADIISTNNDSDGANEARSQPQIIIYRYINSNGQEVVLPASSPQGNDFVVSESEGSSDTPTTYKVLLQSADDVRDSNHVPYSSNVTYTFSSSNAAPVTDSQNTVDGMSRPCPVCGDKVSGYHYGIFTCESCKGFFKRTVQNKKTFVCPKASDCIINSLNRKKCPACRFKQCLVMGMKLEAIRQDRTRGGRSSYDGCVTHLKNRVPTFDKKLKRVGNRIPLLGDVSDQSQDAREGTKSHRHLVAILNHDTHRQTSPNCGTPQIPELLRDIMNLEPLLSDDDLPAESLMEAPFHEQALYSYMMQLAELRLYKLVRWARNLPQFGAISTDDQILLLQNCWSELIALSLCWRSIDTPNQISISTTHHITAEWAQHLGFEDVVVRLLNIAEKFRKLYMDQFEYVALKVLLLITPDVKGLKEPRKIRDFQEKLTEALLAYTTSHYPHMKDKFGQLLLRLPELSRISFLSKDILIKSLPPSLPCGLLVELLKGDNKGEGDGSSLSL